MSRWSESTKESTVMTASSQIDSMEAGSSHQSTEHRTYPPYIYGGRGSDDSQASYEPVTPTDDLQDGRANIVHIQTTDSGTENDYLEPRKAPLPPASLPAVSRLPRLLPRPGLAGDKTTVPQSMLQTLSIRKKAANVPAPLKVSRIRIYACKDVAEGLSVPLTASVHCIEGRLPCSRKRKPCSTTSIPTQGKQGQSSPIAFSRDSQGRTMSSTRGGQKRIVQQNTASILYLVCIQDYSQVYFKRISEELHLIPYKGHFCRIDKQCNTLPRSHGFLSTLQSSDAQASCSAGLCGEQVCRLWLCFVKVAL